MTPVQYAQELSKTQGSKYALAMANRLVSDMELVGAAGGCPFADEVEMQEQTTIDKETKAIRTRTITTVDEKAKSKRVKGTLVFWQQVAGYLKNHP